MILLLLISTLFAIIKSQQFDATTQAQLYLSQYGYLSRQSLYSGNLMDINTWEEAVADFQNFAGLEATGEINQETLDLMASPRCGVRDKIGRESRSRRYALQGSRWKVKTINYRISKYTKKLPRPDVDAEIGRAFEIWSNYTDLTFKLKLDDPVHIDIRFEDGEHGDGDPFDGTGGTLAHAYFPIFGGDAHFDEAEVWTINSKKGTNLFQVAAHEFGHSLGLSHSDVRSALMAPFYRGYVPNFRLDPDDVQAIQALYGNKEEPTTVSPTTKKPPIQHEDTSLCENPQMNTIFTTADNQIYVFVKEKYYQITRNKVDGAPGLISEGWPGLESNIDAAFTYRNGKTYFFKDSRYWRYTGRRMDGDYPKKISSGFPGIPNNIDAALVWGGNGKIYFSRGTQFWRFDPQKRRPVLSKYPLPIKAWEGVPDHLTAAMQINGFTYFFKGDKYYRFNDRTFSIDKANPAFPRPIAFWWFGCRNTPMAFERTIEDIDELAQEENVESTDDSVTVGTLNKSRGYSIITSSRFLVLVFMAIISLNAILVS